MQANRYSRDEDRIIDAIDAKRELERSLFAAAARVQGRRIKVRIAKGGKL